MTLQEIGITIVANTDQVVQLWEELVQREPELARLREQMGSRHLCELFSSVAEAALLQPESRQARLNLVWRAARHGQAWRAANHPQPLLLREHHLMQRALARYVNGFAADSRAHLEAIARLDMAINLCMRAAQHGYERPEHEAEGQWPQVVEMLAWDWMPPAQVP